MDRKRSAHSDRSMSRGTPPPLPPWETESTAKVPFIDPTSLPPSTGQPRRPSWSSRSYSQSYGRSSPAPAGSTLLEPRYPFPTHRGSYNYPRRSHSSAESPSQPFQAPDYNTSSNPLLGSRSQNQEPSFQVPRPPPSPPTSDNTSFESDSPPPEPALSPPETTKAFPGTMSARVSESKESSRSRSKFVPKPAPRTETAPKGKRFRSAFKDMFRREPIDESQFERIGERHWAED